MSAIAIAKGVDMPARKVAVVAALVRGRSVSDALTILDHVPRASATAVKKTIISAKSNAVYNHNYKEDGLFISEISVLGGPSLKRSRPIAHGSFHRILKRTCHIRVVVDGNQRVAKKVVKEVSDKPVVKAKKETK
jgi:large subunit ribosomal protein L22